MPNGAKAALHCCAVPEDQVMLLRCDDSPSDHIASIEVAMYGSSIPAHLRTCGAEHLKEEAGRTKSVKKTVKRHCLGEKECLLHPRRLTHDPSVGNPKLLHVRWTCLSDREAGSGAGARALPPLPLRTQGNKVVDDNGSRVRLTGVAWSGANNINSVPAGLNLAPLRVIVRQIRELGFNFVRFTFSTEMVLSNPVIELKFVAANPWMEGMTALEILDACVDALIAEGILVLLDNHSLNSEWCCSTVDCNGLWFNADFTAEQWEAALVHMAERYKEKPAVFAVGLKNEPRQIDDAETCNIHPHKGPIRVQWTSEFEGLSYKEAVENAGRKVLDANPNVIVSIGGPSFAARLQAVQRAPVDLPPNRHMYEAHEYHWTNGDWTSDPPSNSTYWERLKRNWGFILEQSISPVLVAEFGLPDDFRGSFEGKWYESFSKYMAQSGPLADVGGLDWAYWQLGGVYGGSKGSTPGNRESYGIMNWCWTGPYSDERTHAIQSLMS